MWALRVQVFAQYREAGVLMWRGFTIQNCADQVTYPWTISLVDVYDRYSLDAVLFK